MTRTSIELTMAAPMPGFEQLTRFKLESLAGLEPFYRLRSLEDAEVSFTVLNPCNLEPGYRMAVSRRLRQLDLSTDSNWHVFAVVTPAGRGSLGLNLLAPVVVFPSSLQVAQVVLSDPYSTCHLLPNRERVAC